MIRQQLSGHSAYGAAQGEYAGGMRWNVRQTRQTRLGSASVCASRQAAVQFVTATPAPTLASVALPPLTSARAASRQQPHYVQPTLPGMAPRAAMRRHADATPAAALPATFATLVAPALTPTDAPRSAALPKSPRRAAKPAIAQPGDMKAGKQSVRTTISVRQRFGELRSALAEGWEIVQPIFARPLWSVADDSANAFNFVLQREHATRLVIVPEGRTISRFIRDRRLIVDYRR